LLSPEALNIIHLYHPRTFFYKLLFAIIANIQTLRVNLVTSGN
jgi:hypothetical protein